MAGQVQISLLHTCLTEKKEQEEGPTKSEKEQEEPLLIIK